MGDIIYEESEAEEEESIDIKVNGVAISAKGRTSWLVAIAAAVIGCLMF